MTRNKNSDYPLFKNKHFAIIGTRKTRINLENCLVFEENDK